VSKKTKNAIKLPLKKILANSPVLANFFSTQGKL